MDQITNFRAFLRVAETGSFSMAARQLGVGQPAVSKAVAALEAHWRTALFTRTTRRLALTEQGRMALGRIRSLLEELESIESEIGGPRAMARIGLLRITGSIAFTRAELAPFAQQFLDRHPNIRLEFAARDDRVDLIAEGIDLAFRLGRLADSSMVGKRLGAYERVIVASPELARRRPRTPEDLAKLPAIRFAAAERSDRFVLHSGRKRREITIDGPVSASTGRLVLDFVRMGLGCALLPSFLVRRDIEAGRIVRILPDWSGEPVPLHAIWPTGRSLPPKARAYLDFITPRLTARDHDAAAAGV